MKRKRYSYLALVFVLAVSSCVPAVQTVMPAQTESSTPLATLTLESTLEPTFAVKTPPTLEPDQADGAIRAYLQKPTSCSAPCFWEIVPGKTTIGEASGIFMRLGLQINHTTFNGKDLYGVEYFFGKGLSSITLTVENGIVRNLETNILPDEQGVEAPREWLAYSPEILIKQFGTPSKVDLFVGRAAPTPLHSMVLYFDTVELIVEYSGVEIITDMATLKVCPLTAQVDSVRLWMGDLPQYPPPTGVPLEDGTSLTLESFSELMVGNPNDACFNLKTEKFP